MKPAPSAFGNIGQRLVDLFADISPVTKAFPGREGDRVVLVLHRIEAEALYVELRRLREQGTHEWPRLPV